MRSTSHDGPANSFTFLRLVLALTVVYGHCYALGGFGDEPMARFSAGAITARELAVDGFFIISGFLLTNSLLRRPSLGRFFVRRGFRIFPGYWVALLVTAFVAAPLMFRLLFGNKLTYGESLHLSEYNALGYAWKNALLWQAQKWILPLFLKNPSPGVVNGSLWSLFYEAFCYVALAGVAWVGALRRWPVTVTFALLYLPSLVHHFTPLPALAKGPVIHEMFNMALHPAGPCVVLAFIAGMVARLWFEERPAWQTRWVIFTVLILIASCPLGIVRLVWPIALPYLLIALAERLPFAWLDRVGDFSYGIYIYSFLIQQCLFALGWAKNGIGTFMLLSFGLSVAAGAASWFGVERWAISFGQGLLSRPRLAVENLETAAPAQGK